MEAIHNAKILHLDLKTDNIVLTRLDSGDVSPLIIDFGFAQEMRRIETSRNHYVYQDFVVKKSACGTPLYMAPELFKDRKQYVYNPGIEVYALGAILYEIMQGMSNPFNLRRQAFPKPLPYSVKGPVIKEVAEIMEGCLQFDNTDRMSVGDILELIRRSKDSHKSGQLRVYKESYTYKNDGLHLQRDKAVIYQGSHLGTSPFVSKIQVDDDSSDKASDRLRLNKEVIKLAKPKRKIKVAKKLGLRKPAQKRATQRPKTWDNRAIYQRPYQAKENYMQRFMKQQAQQRNDRLYELKAKYKASKRANLDAKGG